MNTFTKDRKLVVNIIIAIFALLGLFLVPSLFALIFMKVIKNRMVCVVLGDLLYIGVLYLIYSKDLNKEAKIYFKDFKNKFKHSFKYYILGYMGMIFFNLLIYIFLKNISSNEEQVRELLYNNAALTFISISIIAPLSEEIIFRKSVSTIFKNKWLFIIISGLLFGSAHILTDILNNEFALTDLAYVLPYGCLGASFALMDYESKTTFSSIIIHMVHNTITGILLLITYHFGA